ncbi:hypothetical protein ACIQGZ_11105 [Streptomyces sp. NPDC092296]|uniref:hypothetical protein n=1 Tax=Streptomyces sp. NPDC092296 TaxID=3366012 RepID=UPI003821E879
MAERTRPPARRRRVPVVGGLLVAGLLTAGTGTWLALRPDASAGGHTAGTVTAGVVAAGQSADCAALTAALTAGRTVDTGRAIACERQEATALDAMRRQALARGERPAAGSSTICAAVERRAAQGDPALDRDLAFHCRQHEHFGPGGGPDPDGSFCRGVRARAARGAPLTTFQRSLCPLTTPSPHPTPTP